MIWTRRRAFLMWWRAEGSNQLMATGRTWGLRNETQIAREWVGLRETRSTGRSALSEFWKATKVSAQIVRRGKDACASDVTGNGPFRHETQQVVVGHGREDSARTFSKDQSRTGYFNRAAVNAVRFHGRSTRPPQNERPPDQHRLQRQPRRVIPPARASRPRSATLSTACLMLAGNTQTA